MDELKEKNVEIWEENDLVFPIQNGGPQNPENAENAFYRIMKSAGLVVTRTEKDAEGNDVEKFRPNFRIHDLRHAQASMLMLSGENPEAVRKRMGHHSVTFTLSVYTHASQKIDREIADKLHGKYIKKEIRTNKVTGENEAKSQSEANDSDEPDAEE